MRHQRGSAARTTQGFVGDTPLPCVPTHSPPPLPKSRYLFSKSRLLLVVVHKELDEGRRGCRLQPPDDESCVGDDAWFRNLNAQQQRHNMEYIYIYI